MALCLLALPLFAILGIFSIKYRTLAKDALHCLFRTVTLRKCESGLDDRIRSSITGNLLPYLPRTAKFVYRHYQLLSWILVVLVLWSGYESTIGLINYAKYGNCNGPASTGFCLFDPTGTYSSVSEVDALVPEKTTLPINDDTDPLIGDPNAPITIIEFGCYSCPYTKRAEPIVRELLKKYNSTINVRYKSFIIPRHDLALPSALAADCAREQNAYLSYHHALFEHQEHLNKTTLYDIAQDIGLNMTTFTDCLTTERYRAEVDLDVAEGLAAGVHATPTFFINNRIIVGPKPTKTFEAIIEELT